ncbi:sporulation protein YqfD [Bacillus piscicola]|uniref:sporulation protein YqfD n=1 Tax=Bacillus piscicola TaxID=1632684 RepID=UPI001F096E7E|nr:sporulation protein YqfD [Bacillus piscicola]
MNKQRGPSDVKVKLNAERLESIINECFRQNIVIKDVVRTDSNSVTFLTPLSSMGDLESIVSQYGGDIEVLKPSLMESYRDLIRRRVGFFTGILVFVTILIVLSQMVWKIEIRGADPDIEQTIVAGLEDIGLQIGTFQFLLPSPAGIQKEILDKTDGVTWIGVERKGTAYYLNVAEQSLPEEKETPSPRHIISKKTAVVQSIYAEKGQVVVQENDLVKKGDLLISGFIGKGENAKAVPASGKVLGETWYKTTVELPIKQKVNTLTGPTTKMYAIQLFGLRLPVWGFSAKEEYDDYVVTERVFNPAIKEWELPAAWVVTTYSEKNTTEQSSSVQEAKKHAQKAARYKMKKRLPKEAHIKDEKILQSRTQDGKVKLVIHYQVIEDITSEAPIIQGD